MARCPFYGFRWPDRSSALIPVGGNECGLDVDTHGRCQMELTGAPADYFTCRLVASRANLLNTSERIIRFVLPEGRCTLSDWIDRNSRSGS